MSLEGKVALVTGASRGIGRAAATALAAAGAHVAVNFVSRSEAAAEVKREIEALGRECLLVQADVATRRDVERMTALVLERFGRVDILVNNATLHRGGKVDRLSESDWESVIDSCLRGAFHCCQQVVPHMTARRSGCLINVSSIMGRIGWPGDAAYGTAKAGLVGFTRSLAKELAPHGIRANVVMPGIYRDGHDGGADTAKQGTDGVTHPPGAARPARGGGGSGRLPGIGVLCDGSGLCRRRRDVAVRDRHGAAITG